jgi:hypothetical protein
MPTSEATPHAATMTPMMPPFRLCFDDYAASMMSER